ncbi:MAG: orotidine-5'-phosphate decarboxylase [Actinobacteria bacterium]|nr:orotidine-5'-phosphate decarboxylase [Actinomycetota bacterium]
MIVDRGPARLALALDTDELETALDWARSLAHDIDCLKIGLQFYLRYGAPGVAAVREAAPEPDLFLDLKLHDIPATVRGAVRAIESLEPGYLTVHASGGSAMIAAAASALPRCRITAVTVLTSLRPMDMQQLGLGNPADTAARWAGVATSCGAGAVVCSAQEAARLRPIVGDRVEIVTPGVRPADGALADQARVATPYEAVLAGADLLVVGRPITRAEDPVQATRAIRESMREARAVLLSGNDRVGQH